MFKTSVNEEKIGRMQDDGKMGVQTYFHITVENERGNIVFSWTDFSKEQTDADVAKFNSVKNDTAALKAFVAEIKGRERK